MQGFLHSLCPYFLIRKLGKMRVTTLPMPRDEGIMHRKHFEQSLAHWKGLMNVNNPYHNIRYILKERQKSAEDGRLE